MKIKNNGNLHFDILYQIKIISNILAKYEWYKSFLCTDFLGQGRLLPPYCQDF